MVSLEFFGGESPLASAGSASEESEVAVADECTRVVVAPLREVPVADAVP